MHYSHFSCIQTRTPSLQTPPAHAQSTHTRTTTHTQHAWAVYTNDRRTCISWYLHKEKSLFFFTDPHPIRMHTQPTHTHAHTNNPHAPCIQSIAPSSCHDTHINDSWLLIVTNFVSSKYHELYHLNVTNWSMQKSLFTCHEFSVI